MNKLFLLVVLLYSNVSCHKTNLSISRNNYCHNQASLITSFLHGINLGSSSYNTLIVNHNCQYHAYQSNILYCEIHNMELTLSIYIINGLLFGTLPYLAHKTGIHPFIIKLKALAKRYVLKKPDNIIIRSRMTDKAFYKIKHLNYY